MSNKLKFILLFLALYAFRTLYGLCHSFFSPDELQTYLIGLKWYCHGGWPYFGPDLIVTETGFYSQIPGPLEAWMVGYPLVIWAIPEAPFLFLNFFSTGAIALLAWYLSKRLPQMPFLFLFAWIALLPWNLHESTNPINPSYLLMGSTLFFIGFLEAIPSFSKDYLPPAVAFGMMGFGLFWDMQFHSAWVLLPPFVLLAFALRLRDKHFHFMHDFVAFWLGSLPMVAILLPTYLKYGPDQGAGGFHLMQAFNLANFLSFFTVLLRFLSLPCHEVIRFLNAPGQLHHLDMLKDRFLWLWPGFVLIPIGWFQALSLLVMGWFKDEAYPEGRTLSKIVLFAFLLVWGSFCFSSKEPWAHIYYILMPLLVVYSLYIWNRWASHPVMRRLALACLAASVWFQAAYALHVMKTQSLYTDRALVQKAIQEKNEHLLGERRPGALY